MSENAIGNFGFILLVLVVVSFGLTRCTGCMPTYSSGERTGVIVKLSEKGLMFKSWEGQMNLGSASVDGGGMMVPTVWEFSSLDDAMAAQINEAARNGKRVTLKYRQWLMPPWTISSSYEIESVIVSE